MSRALWDADVVRDDLQNYVVERLGDSEGVLTIDETELLKKDDESAGAARQYFGTASGSRTVRSALSWSIVRLRGQPSRLIIA